MADFKMTNKDAIKSDYEGGIKVYLESSDDTFIFKNKWFANYNDKISFEGADFDGSSSAGGGGCQVVIDKVRSDTDANKISYGIVDRDRLLSDPVFSDSLWWEINDDVFASANPYGDQIFVLHHWEIENYLLHPQALYDLGNDKLMGHIEYSSPTEIAKKLCLSESDYLLLTLLSTISTKMRTTQASDGYGRGKKDDLCGDPLLQSVTEKLAIGPEDELFVSHKRNIESFSEDIDANSQAITRWEKCSRMFDGKRLLGRLGKELFPDKGIDLTNEKAVLASYVKNKKLVNTYLEAWVGKIYSAA